MVRVRRGRNGGGSIPQIRIGLVVAEGEEGECKELVAEDGRCGIGLTIPTFFKEKVGKSLFFPKNSLPLVSQ